MNSYQYVIRRTLWAIPTLLLLLTLTFFLLRLAPGGPFDGDQAWPKEIEANIQARYHLDKPLPVQFGNWLWSLAHGDLNESFQYLGHPVTEIIAESLPISAALGLSALLISILVGIPLGALCAAKKDTLFDRFIQFFSTSGVSLPSFLTASFLIFIFSLWLNWLPAALWEGASSAVLPILTLAIRPISILIRLTRSTVLEVSHLQFIRVARSKGLEETVILYKHTLRNALIPVVSVVGPLTANLITGSFLVELVFQIPGMGKHFIQAVLNRDYPLVMGVTLVYGVILIFSNLLVDLLYGVIDPRIANSETDSDGNRSIK